MTHPPLYALTPVDQVEINQAGEEHVRKYCAPISKQGIEVYKASYAGFVAGVEWVKSLRPLPAGTMAVSEEELMELVKKALFNNDWAMSKNHSPDVLVERSAAIIIKQFIQSKLAQQGNKEI